MTNSKLLTLITELKTEIGDQINLSTNIFKLENTDASSIHQLVDTTLNKITKLKNYQLVITLRNLKIVTYKDQETQVYKLIKLREELLLKKQLMTPLIRSTPSNDELVKLSLEAFQKIQEYKTQLDEIYYILNTFNNEEYEIKDYE